MIMMEKDWENHTRHHGERYEPYCNLTWDEYTKQRQRDISRRDGDVRDPDAIRDDPTLRPLTERFKP